MAHIRQNLRITARLAAIVLFAALTPTILMTAPAVAAQLASQWQLSPARIGDLFSVELGAMSLATLPAWWWLKRVDWRTAARVAALLFIAAMLFASNAMAVKPGEEDDKKECKYEFVKIPIRPMIQIDIMLEDGIDLTRQLIAEIEKHDLSNAIVKILYHLPAQKTGAGNVDFKTVLDMYQEAVYATNDDCRKYQKTNNPEAVKDTDLLGIYPSREEMMEEIKLVSAKVEALTDYVTELVKVTTKGLEGITENLVD